MSSKLISFLVTVTLVPALMLLVLGSYRISDGCNPRLASECQKYVPIHGTAAIHSVLNQTCTVCTNYKFNQCFKTEEVQCFSSFTEFYYDSGKSSCFFQSADKVLNETIAWNTAKQFDIGEKYFFIAKKRHRETCLDPENQSKTWTDGIIMLSIAGFCFIFEIFCTIILVREENQINRINQINRLTRERTILLQMESQAELSPDIPHIPTLKSGVSRVMPSLQQDDITKDNTIVGEETRIKPVPIIETATASSLSTRTVTATTTAYRAVHVMNAELVCEDLENDYGNSVDGGVSPCDEV